MVSPSQLPDVIVGSTIERVIGERFVENYQKNGLYAKIADQAIC